LKLDPCVFWHPDEASNFGAEQYRVKCREVPEHESNPLIEPQRRKGAKKFNIAFCRLFASLRLCGLYIPALICENAATAFSGFSQRGSNSTE